MATDPDNTFRYAIIAGLVMIVCVGAPHRIRSRTGEALDRRQEGLFILIALRLSALAGFAAMVAYLVRPSSLGWSAVRLPSWLRWGGVGLGFLTVCLLFWTLQSLGKNLTDTVVTRKNHTLVITGPYRWVRHPFYVCAALLVVTSFFVTANALFLATGGLVLLLLGVRTRVEERNLLNRFGQDYRSYMGRTGRFVPRLHS